MEATSEPNVTGGDRRRLRAALGRSILPTRGAEGFHSGGRSLLRFWTTLATIVEIGDHLPRQQALIARSRGGVIGDVGRANDGSIAKRYGVSFGRGVSA